MEFGSKTDGTVEWTINAGLNHSRDIVFRVEFAALEKNKRIELQSRLGKKQQILQDKDTNEALYVQASNDIVKYFTQLFELHILKDDDLDWIVKGLKGEDGMRISFETVGKIFEALNGEMEQNVSDVTKKV